jgi:Type I phosphodiesterase / nucleotide pyrophosphatase
MKFAGFTLIASFALVSFLHGASELKTKNVVLVTIDGLRWQEVFRGSDDAMANKEFGGVSDKALVFMQAEFARPTVKERRESLMPFFWSKIVTDGQLYGNRDTGSPMRVTNGVSISYPGYNEMLCGFPDDKNILNNGRVPNPNITVLEWLNAQPEFNGKVVPVAAWNVFESIFNVKRSGLPLWLTNQSSDPATASPRLLEIEQWMRDIPTKGRDEHYDAFVYRAALDAIDSKQPRLLFVGFGEPDTYGHRRAYDSYLDSIRRCDRFIRELWEKLQATPQYRDTTTLIVTTDHGRGRSPQDWANHSTKMPGSDETWVAILGPDTPPLGERHAAGEIATAQLAATVAQFLGRDYHAVVPLSAPAIPDVFPLRPDKRAWFSAGERVR